MTSSLPQIPSPHRAQLPLGVEAVEGWEAAVARHLTVQGILILWRFTFNTTVEKGSDRSQGTRGQKRPAAELRSNGRQGWTVSKQVVTQSLQGCVSYTKQEKSVQAHRRLNQGIL